MLLLSLEDVVTFIYRYTITIISKNNTGLIHWLTMLVQCTWLTCRQACLQIFSYSSLLAGEWYPAPVKWTFHFNGFRRENKKKITFGISLVFSVWSCYRRCSALQLSCIYFKFILLDLVLLEHCGFNTIINDSENVILLVEIHLTTISSTVCTSSQPNATLITTVATNSTWS